MRQSASCEFFLFLYVEIIMGQQCALRTYRILAEIDKLPVGTVIFKNLRSFVKKQRRWNVARTTRERKKPFLFCLLLLGWFIETNHMTFGTPQGCYFAMSRILDRSIQMTAQLDTFGNGSIHIMNMKLYHGRISC